MMNVSNLAHDYAIKLGISPSVSGFGKFTKAVTVYVSSQEDQPKLETVCEEIGGKVKHETVARSISYALKHATNLRDNLYELTGRKVREENISPKQVICLVADCIKRDLAE